MNAKLLKNLGIRVDNMKNGLVPYFVLTIIFSLGSLLYLNLFGTSLMGLWHQLYPSPLVLVLIAFLQELFFRSILMLGLKSQLKNALAVVLIDAIIFAVAHVIFPFPELLVPGAFLVGLGFAVVYYHYPNLILAGLSHSVVNLVVIPVCYLKLINC